MIVILARDKAVASGVQQGLVDAGHDAEVVVDVDATNMRAVRSIIAELRPKAVLHMAFLDDAVACEANPDRAFLHNAESVINIAAATLEFAAIPVIWSPAHVLAGAGHRGEDDAPTPTSTWTESRIRGEVFLRRAAPRGLVLRSGPVLSPGLASEAQRLSGGVTSGSALVQPVLAPWLGTVLSAALANALQGVIHVPSAGPARPEHEIWKDIARRVGAASTLVQVDPMAGASSAVLKCERAGELGGLGEPPDWTQGLVVKGVDAAAANDDQTPESNGAGSAAPPPTDAPQPVSETPRVWLWVLKAGDTHRWTAPCAVAFQVAAGKAFVESDGEDTVLKGLKHIELASGSELRITVPEPTVVVVVALAG